MKDYIILKTGVMILKNLDLQLKKFAIIFHSIPVFVNVTFVT